MNRRWQWLVVVILLAWLGVGFCADNAQNIGSNKNIDHAVVVADLTNGYLQKVDTQGTAKASEGLKTVAFVNSQSAGGELVRTGAATVYSLTVSGTANNDYAVLYDALTATGTPILDVVVSTSTPTITVPIPGGRLCSTGIFVDLGTATTHAEAEYIVN